jgi:hypothetical protein
MDERAFTERTALAIPPIAWTQKLGVSKAELEKAVSKLE